MKYSLFILTIFALSCSSVKKLVDKAVKKDKAEVARMTRELFPCGIIARDTTVVIDTVSEFVECPESTILTVYKTDTTIDTVVLKKFVKVPVLMPQRTLYITQRFEDSAKIYLLQFQNKVNVDYIVKLKQKIHTKNIILVWLLIIFGLSILAMTLLKKVR